MKLVNTLAGLAIEVGGEVIPLTNRESSELAALCSERADLDWKIGTRQMAVYLRSHPVAKGWDIFLLGCQGRCGGAGSPPDKEE